MPERPTGTVTFMFTDIEQSTRLLQRVGDMAYRELLATHAGLIRKAISAGGGTEVSTEGDSFFAVFPTAPGALRAAVKAQRALSAHLGKGNGVRVRMGLHTGQGILGADGYVGLDIHRAARIGAAGHGGQILISAATKGLIERALPGGVRLGDLGLHRLKDIEQLEHLHQVLIEGLPDRFPPIKSLDARQTNLPAERTSFVGREREVAEVAAILGRVRLLTLTGPGGIGKTRLALAVATEAIERFADGVYMADLSPITDAGLVPAALAGALQVRDEPGSDPLVLLADHLRDRQVLLVVDNVEHLPEAAAVVGHLLDEAPRLTVLSTSRVPLHIAGEHEYQVPPLELPDAGDLADPGAVSESEAVRLFVERATAVDQGFRLTSQNVAAISELTVRLDGLPLAIELAAGRTKVLSPPTILDRLEGRLSLLTGGARDLPARQRTLRAAIEWSHDLLRPNERQLFARLAVFRGGWTIDAAEAVCAPDPARSVFDEIASLLDQSLIRRAGAVATETRFGWLETIHEFARERLLASGERDEVRRRHAEYYRALVEESGQTAGEPDAASLRRVDLERDNVRAALTWALETGEAEIGLRTATAVWTFWPRRDLAEGRSWLHRLLSLPNGQRRDAIRARALTSLGVVHLWQNEYNVSRVCLEEAVDIAREAGDVRLVARAIDSLEVLARAGGDLDLATTLVREGLAAAKVARDPVLIAEFRSRLGLIDIFRGHPADSIEPLTDALAVQRQAGATSKVVLLLASLGTAERMTGNVAVAKDHYREALGLAFDHGNMVLVGTVIVGFAFIASSESRHERAARLLGASESIRRSAGGGPSPELLRKMGDPEGDARRTIGDEAFERERAVGEEMVVNEAVSFAVSDQDPLHKETSEEVTGV